MCLAACNDDGKAAPLICQRQHMLQARNQSCAPPGATRLAPQLWQGSHTIWPRPYVPAHTTKSHLQVRQRWHCSIQRPTRCLLATSWRGIAAVAAAAVTRAATTICICAWALRHRLRGKAQQIGALRNAGLLPAVACAIAVLCSRGSAVALRGSGGTGAGAGDELRGDGVCVQA